MRDGPLSGKHIDKNSGSFLLALLSRYRGLDNGAAPGLLVSYQHMTIMTNGQ